jgi:hypothetical protein
MDQAAGVLLVLLLILVLVATLWTPNTDTYRSLHSTSATTQVAEVVIPVYIGLLAV